MAQKNSNKSIQVNIEEGVNTATINGTNVEIRPEGNVVVFTNSGVQVKPAVAVSAEDAPATKDKQITIGEDFNTVAMYGAKVELTTDGTLIVYTNGTVKVKPAAANDAAAPANATTIAAAKATLEIGDVMEDGSVFAGITPDGKQNIYAMSTDLGLTMTFNDAVKAVTKLNNNKALGHDDWQIPSRENLRVLYENQNEGALKGTFNTTNTGERGSGYPGWYWSSTWRRDNSSDVWDILFSDGYGGWAHKPGDCLSCRPVRLVEASSPAPR